MADQITERRGLSVDVPINAPIDAVWKALSDADELAQWFPTGARIEPGVGGKIVYIWREYNDMEFESPITAWEPGKHIRLEDDFGGGGTPVVTDYILEPAPDGEGTILRLVQSGFTSDESWDEMYDGIRRGWASELRALRHYLEHHRGKPRRVICLQRSLGAREPSAVWAEMVESEKHIIRAWPDNPRPGDTVKVALTETETSDGTINLLNGRRQVGLVLPVLDDALLRLTIEPNCSEGFEGLAAGVALNAWGIEPDRIGPIEHFFRARLEAIT